MRSTALSGRWPGAGRAMCSIACVAHARARGVSWQPRHWQRPTGTLFRRQAQPTFLGDLAIEERYGFDHARRNALAMAAASECQLRRALAAIASYASGRLIRGGVQSLLPRGGPLSPTAAATDRPVSDLRFFQPHSAPGVYARAFRLVA